MPLHILEYSDGLCCKLVFPCPKVRPVVAFRELEINRKGIKLMKKLGAGHFGEVWAGKVLLYLHQEILVIPCTILFWLNLLSLSKELE